MVDHCNDRRNGSEDELGLFTAAAEEADFDHIAGLRGYTDQTTLPIVHSVCKQDESCNLNPLPGTPSKSLTKLESEFQDFVHLGGFKYFVKRICEPVLQVARWFSAIGGFITPSQ